VKTIGSTGEGGEIRLQATTETYGVSSVCVYLFGWTIENGANHGRDNSPSSYIYIIYIYIYIYI